MIQNHSELGLAVLGDLGSKVALLEDADVLRIASLLEGGSDDPKALKGRTILRPRLRTLRPARRLNARRVFCTPFEMLLSDEQSPSDPVRAIPRVAVWSVWSQIVERLPARLLRDVEQEAVRARSPLDDQLQPSVAAVWEAAASAIDADFAKMAARAGDSRSLRQIGGAVRAHKAISAVRAMLKGGGLGTPAEPLAKQLTGLIQNALEQGEDAGFATASVVAAHFRSPAAIIGSLLGNGIGADTGAGQAVVKRLCEALGEDMAREITAIQSIDDAADPRDVVAGMTKLTENLQAMQSFAKRTKDTLLRLKLEQAILTARGAAVAEVLPRLSGAVGRNLDLAVGEMMNGGSIDISQQVESNLVALRSARASAEFLGAGEELRAAVDALLASVSDKAASAVQDEGEEDRSNRLMALARFAELLDGADAAQACLTQWMMNEAA